MFKIDFKGIVDWLRKGGIFILIITFLSYLRSVLTSYLKSRAVAKSQDKATEDRRNLHEHLTEAEKEFARQDAETRRRKESS